MAEKKSTELKAESLEQKTKTPKAAKKMDPKPVLETTEEKLVAKDSQLTAATEKSVAKAGKRSAKAIAEVEEKLAKEDRKTHAKTEEEIKPKIHVQPARSKLERKSKKFQELAKLIDKDKEYTLKEAVELAVKTSPTKFDATVELHVNLLVDPKQADQNVRGNLVLPAGTGKNIRVAVFAEAEDAEKAKKAGADIAENDDLLAQLDKEQVDFDVLIAVPTLMGKLGKYARLLGPKGIMPNPKSGTVTTDVARAVKEAKAGRVEYRVDSTGIVHIGVGKVSFGAENLEKNLDAVLTAIKAAKPASIKGVFIKSTFITTSMGPSIKVQA